MLSTKVEYTRHFKTVLGRHDTWSEYIQSNQACIGVDDIFCNFFIKINYFALFDDILTLIFSHCLPEKAFRMFYNPQFPFPWNHPTFPSCQPFPDGISESEFTVFTSCLRWETQCNQQKPKGISKVRCIWCHTQFTVLISLRKLCGTSALFSRDRQAFL